MASYTGIVRLTPIVAANLVETAKGTTTTSINRGDIVKLSSYKWAPVATITDATKSNTLGVAENRSPGSGDMSSRKVSAYVADKLIDYLVGLNTLTSVNVGEYFKLVTTECQQLAKSTTVTDDRVAVCVRTEPVAVNKAHVRFLPHVADLERG